MNVEENLDKVLMAFRESKTVAEVFDFNSFESDIKTLDYTFLKSKEYINDLKNILKGFGKLSQYDYYENNTFANIKDSLDSISCENIDHLCGAYPGKMLAIHALIILYLSADYMNLSRNVESLETAKCLFGQNNNFKEANYFYYRGISNFSYDLIPSMYRNIKNDYVHIDDKYIDNMYKINNLRTEYFKIYNEKSTESFYGYMQHSISFSPLIDFTNNIHVAGSFALNCSNPMAYKNEDSAIYFLIRENRPYNKNEKVDIELFNDKINLFTLVFNKPLYECVSNDFEPRYSIIVNKTNDRMKYQDGLFVFFKKCVFINRKLLFFNSTSRLFKLRIPFDTSAKLNKDSVLYEISSKYPMYKYDYLMDPYKWFSERHK